MTTGEDIIARLRRTWPDLPPEALRWLSQNPENIQWPEEKLGDIARREAGEAETRYWEWVERTYSPIDVRSIRAKGFSGNIWEHYTKNIQGTQWDAPALVPPGPAERQVEFGITPMDWTVLYNYIADPSSVERELTNWISTGYITKAQAATIWNEISGQLPQVIFYRTLLGREEIETRLGRERRPAAIQRYRGPLNIEEMRALGTRRAVVEPEPEPFREFGPALEEMRLGFMGEMPKTERWRDWFRARYPRLIEQFKARVPEEERQEKGWREFLAVRRPEIREQFWRLSPFQRGERPQVFAPRVQTVAF